MVKADDTGAIKKAIENVMTASQALGKIIYEEAAKEQAAAGGAPGCGPDQLAPLSALAGRPYFFFAEKGHRKGENVYGAFGQSDAGRHLVVYFIYKADSSALILSARDMARKDRRRYERR